MIYQLMENIGKQNLIFLFQSVDSSGTEIHLIIHLRLLNWTYVALKLLFSVYTYPGKLMTFKLLAWATILPV